jgi:hypothetical protein
MAKPTSTQVYTYETEAEIRPDQVRIDFVNDLYQPDQGIDRNVTVESIAIDGTEYLTDSNNVFATGVWSSDVEQIVGGFGLGNSLQANGFFQYGLTGRFDQIDFAGRTWDVVEGVATTDVFSVDPSGALTISGANGPLAISTRIDIDSGTLYEFSTFAIRNVEAGGFSDDSQPWATFGINYYNDFGQQTGQAQFEINSELGRDIFEELTPPPETTSAYAWYWIDGFASGVNIPLQIDSFDVVAVEPVDDFVNPEVMLLSSSLTENNETIFNFGVDITDDIRIGTVPGDSLTITGPNGFVADSILATGLPGSTDTFQRLIFFFQAPNGQFTSADNGLYEVSLKPNKVSDFAGNFADAGLLGTIEVAIGPLATA